MTSEQIPNGGFNRNLLEKKIPLYGASFTCKSDSGLIMDRLSFDFTGFDSSLKGAASRDIEISCLLQENRPPIPPVSETFRTSNFVCYDFKGTRYVDYFGRALTTYHYGSETGFIYSQDPEFAFEKLYLTILSRLGLLLDLAGLHRIHALATACSGEACLFLLPQRGGKTTLALDLLFSEPQLRLFSEDTPLLSSDGCCRPFPFRLGTRDSAHLEKIDPLKLRRSISGNGEEKTLVHPDFFRSRIETSALPVRRLFLCRWTGAQHPEIRRAGKLTALTWMIRDCVIGVGVPQVAEIFLKKNAADFLQKAWFALKRLLAVSSTLIRARTFTVSLCSDRAANLALIVSSLKENGA